MTEGHDQLGSRPLSAADDELHPPRDGSPDWAETAWFAAAVPERGIGIWTYPLFRANLGVAAVAVYVWGPGGTELWQQPYYRLFWHLPMPDGLRLSDMELPNGLSYRTREPLTRYEVRYRDGDALHLDLDWTALHPPHAVGVTEEVGHLDQLGRVRGELVLHGERMEIDCVEMRDRTWSPRREARSRTRLGYSYGASVAGTGFLWSDRRLPDGTQAPLGGFALGGSGVRDLVDGRREVRRDAHGRPAAVTVSARDAQGTEVRAAGEVLSQFAMHTTPYFVWVSQVRWRLPDGTVLYGEDQDTWSPGAWREAMRTDDW